MVNKFFASLLIIIIFTINIGFCADTYVTFTQSDSNAFYVWFRSINTNLSNIYNRLLNLPDAISNINTYLPSIYTKLDTYISYLYDIYKYNNNYTLAENYILNEQDNLQDYFIKILENDDDLKNIFKNYQSMQVYGIINAPYANSVLFILYSDTNDKNTYQSNPYNSVLQHRSLSVPSSTSTSKDLILDVVTSNVSYDGFIQYNKNNNAYTKYLTSSGNRVIPTCCLGYRSSTFRAYLQNLYGFNPTIGAINDNTQAIKDSTDRILSNDTETITGTGVTDGATDTSVNLTGIFTSFSNAFTHHTSGVKPFTFRLPNGQGYTTSISSNMLTNLLTAYDDGTLFRFYQAMYWIVLGGYVLFDIKDIINNLKAGDLEKVTKNSSPVDNVVKASVR